MAGTYSVTHVRNKTVVTTFFSLCLEILTWFLVYECIMMSYRSSLHVVLVQWFLAELWPLDWNLAKYLVVTIWDIDLIFGMRVYNHKLQINWNVFQLNDCWPTYSRWALKFGHILISLWFEILTWFLVCECIVMSYRSSLNFVPIEWFWAKLRTLPWTFNFGQIFSCHHALRYWLVVEKMGCIKICKIRQN